MRRILLVTLFLAWGTTVLAAEPQVVWVGGGAQVSDQDRPGYFADTMISLGSSNNLTFFTLPELMVKHSKLGIDLGLGARMPVFSGEMLAGGNAFFDYTNDNNHRRVGLGAELWHPKASGHLNVYLPLSNQHGDEEAIPGIDFRVGIPLPMAPFISIWPGIYYYDGHHEDDLKGLSLEVQAHPVQALTFTLGARNDTPSAGRDDSEVYARINVTIPMRKLDKALFSFNKGSYPLDINSYMDQRVVRESFIAIEKHHE